MSNKRKQSGSEWKNALAKGDFWDLGDHGLVGPLNPPVPPIHEEKVVQLMLGILVT